MHEIFVTASVTGADVRKTLQILQGLCGMKPLLKYERLLTFEGPATQLVAVPVSRIQNRRPQDREPWIDLNKQLVRQSYYINVAYPVEPEHFNSSSATSEVESDQSQKQPTVDIEEMRGNLNFLDYPDPPQAARPVNCRLVVHIKDEPRLPSLLRSIRYKWVAERLQEAYHFYRDNVTLTLSRQLQRPQENVISQGGDSSIPQGLPPLNSFVPYDAQNKWILSASVEVTDEKEGPLMQRGIDELLRIQADLAGHYEFAIIERNVLDTRVPAFLENVRRR